MLRERIGDALKTAMKAKEKHARSNTNNDSISEDEILSMLQSMIKQRYESVAMYEKGGRAELAEREASEIEIIQTFLPKQMDEAAINVAVQEAIGDLSASSLKDMGKVMGALKEKFAGQMDFSKASVQAKVKLS
jgi:uncharacterized protein YqeY